MNTEKTLKVTEIQRFCMHDGPGIRTTVFLKGCPLRCAWCHNPETQTSASELLFYRNKCVGCGVCESSCLHAVHAVRGQRVVDRTKCVLCGECVKYCPTGALEVCGKNMSVDEILSVAERDKDFYGLNGGITLSGGEPFAQNAATVALLKACKEKGLHVVVETCGCVDTNVLLEAVPFVDLFLWDVKDTDDERHKKYTGMSNRAILDNLAAVDASGAKTRLRCILINGVNTREEHYRGVAEIAASLAHCEGVEFLPYHTYGGAKKVFLGGEDNGKNEWIPTDEQLERAKSVLKENNVGCF